MGRDVVFNDCIIKMKNMINRQMRLIEKRYDKVKEKVRIWRKNPINKRGNGKMM